jgi:hypothetical protein
MSKKTLVQTSSLFSVLKTRNIKLWNFYKRRFRLKWKNLLLSREIIKFRFYMLTYTKLKLLMLSYERLCAGVLDSVPCISVSIRRLLHQTPTAVTGLTPCTPPIHCVHFAWRMHRAQRVNWGSGDFRTKILSHSDLSLLSSLLLLPPIYLFLSLLIYFHSYSRFIPPLILANEYREPFPGGVGVGGRSLLLTPIYCWNQEGMEL